MRAGNRAGLEESSQASAPHGIHSGPVNEVTSADDRANVAGAGINIAQRGWIAAMPATFIKQTRRRRFGESRTLAAVLARSGEVTVKHGVSLTLLTLHDDLGAAQVPAKVSGRRDPRLFWRDERGVRGETRSFCSLIALAAIGLGFFFPADRLLRRPIETQMTQKHCGSSIRKFQRR